MVLGEVGFVVVLYSLCSGGMLILNKLAVHHTRAPAFVTLLQFMVSTLWVLLGHAMKCIELDRPNWRQLRYFVIYVLAFSAGTWSNMKVLVNANVETVIVFRSCAPLCVCLTDCIFHGRALPSRRSVLAMLMILAGASIYVHVDHGGGRSNHGSRERHDTYFWVVVWFTLLIFQLTFGKTLVTGLGLRSIWSSVLFTNALAIPPTTLLGALVGDFAQLDKRVWTLPALVWVILSCVAGVGISWTGFKCQQVVTATAYTVIGVMNKLLTVLINVSIWDKHASPLGIGALCICLLGGSLYQQSPLRIPREAEALLGNRRS